jgi:hypothetical protein
MVIYLAVYLFWLNLSLIFIDTLNISVEKVRYLKALIRSHNIL